MRSSPTRRSWARTSRSACARAGSTGFSWAATPSARQATPSSGQERPPMQQTMVLEDGLDRRLPANHQAPDTGGHVAASTGTSELVARASAGEQGAWDQLVERYGGLVWAVARAHGLGHADASDVSQVTWLLLTQHLDALQQPERLGSWLLGTARREADRMRRLRGCEVPTPTSTPRSDIPASASVAGPAGPGREQRLLVWSESGRPSASSEEHNERRNEGERDARESEPPPRRPERGPGPQ
jgi:DNA-directed RNA polymerase specialized sigma24 family protein